MKMTFICTVILSAVICIMVIARFVYVRHEIDDVASLVEQTRYIVFVWANLSQKKVVSPETNTEISKAIRRKSRIKLIGQKSVSHGVLFLFDEHDRQIARIGVLKFPLVTINGIQVELDYNILESYGVHIDESSDKNEDVSK